MSDRDKPDRQSGAQTPTGSEGQGASSGPELARAALEAALRKRAGRPPAPRRDGEAPRKRGYSGPGPDQRDPAKFGDVLARLIKSRGWERPAAEATLFGSWPQVVGPDIAQHSRPISLDNGELTIEAESAAWATQLRLLNASILSRIAASVGHNLVTKLRIHGPAAQGRGKGKWRVR